MFNHHTCYTIIYKGLVCLDIAQQSGAAFWGVGYIEVRTPSINLDNMNSLDLGEEQLILWYTENLNK